MRLFTSIPLVLCFLCSFAQSAGSKEDPFLVTAVCDEAKSRITTIKLLDYVDQVFNRYSMAKPSHDSVTNESINDDEPKVEMHEADFGTFRASFEMGKDRKRILWSLTTRSRRFPLPFGVEFGQTMAQVQKHLGPPTALSSDTILYSTGGEEISDVYFRFEGNKLAEINWNHGMAD